MSDAPEDERNTVLDAAVRRKRAQVDRGQRDTERSFSRNLALMGALGWSVVAPLLLSILLGRWLDRVFETDYFWTLALLFAGIAFGGVMVWKTMHRE